MWMIFLLCFLVLSSAILIPNDQFSAVYLGQYNNVNDFVDEMMNIKQSK